MESCLKKREISSLFKRLIFFTKQAYQLVGKHLEEFFL